jgi:MAE_28990/MAE_18760-like HEPN
VIFSSVQSDLATRLSRLATYVGGIDDGGGVLGAGDPRSPDLKGLFFVYLYAVYERCVDEACRAAYNIVNRHGISCREVRPELLALGLNAQFDSLEAASGKRQWQRRADVMRSSVDVSAVQICDMGIPMDGSHMRVQQLETIWKLLGIDAPVVPHPRYIDRIHELVERRHAVAHGREMPDEVGRRFTIDDLKARLVDVEACCTYFIRTIEGHVALRANVCR